MSRVVAVRYALEVSQSINFIKPRLAIVGHPVSSLEAYIAIRIELSVFYFLALYATLLAIFLIGFALHVVKRSGICARYNNTLRGSHLKYFWR